MRVRKQQLYTGVLFLLIAASLLLWNAFIPVFEAADEPGYYQHVYFLATEKKLPNLNDKFEQAGVNTYPPLYYLPLTPLVRVFNPPSIYDSQAMQMRSDRREGFRHESFNWFDHTTDEIHFKWDRLQLTVHLMRLWSSLLGLGTVFLIYLSGLIYFKNRSLSIIASMFIGFNPMFNHLHSTIIILPLLIFIGSLIFYLLIKCKKSTLQNSFILGGLVGLSVITKIQGIAFVPISVIWILWKSWKEGRLVWMKKVLGFLLAFLAFAAWWYLRNLKLYGNILAIDNFVFATGTRASMPELMGLVNYWVGFFTSQFATFWTGYGWAAVYFSNKIQNILLGLVLFSILKVITDLGRLSDGKKDLAIFLIGSSVFFESSLLIAHIKFPVFHAKDLFPVIVPIALLLVSGWHSLFKSKFDMAKLQPSQIIIIGLLLFLINSAYLLIDVSPKLTGTYPLF